MQVRQQRTEYPQRLKDESTNSCITGPFTSKKEATTECSTAVKIQSRLDVRTVSHGGAGLLQAPNSDVSLSIPEGVSGVVLMNVDTSWTDIQTVIPQGECLIAPVVRITSPNYKYDFTNQTFELKIPHALPEEDLWGKIKVRQGKGQNYKKLKSKKDADAENNTFYECDDRFIRIRASQLSDYICTVDEKCCTTRLRVLLFAKTLKQEPNKTFVQIKCYLCSSLSLTKNLKKELRHHLQKFGLYPIAEDDTIVPEGLHPEELGVTLMLTAREAPSVRWDPSENDDLQWDPQQRNFVKTADLSSLIRVTGGHLCRYPEPLEAMTVDLTSESNPTCLGGTLDVTVHPIGQRSKYEFDTQAISKRVTFGMTNQQTSDMETEVVAVKSQELVQKSLDWSPPAKSSFSKFVKIFVVGKHIGNKILCLKVFIGSTYGWTEQTTEDILHENEYYPIAESDVCITAPNSGQPCVKFTLRPARNSCTRLYQVEGEHLSNAINFDNTLHRTDSKHKQVPMKVLQGEFTTEDPDGSFALRLDFDICSTDPKLVTGKRHKQLLVLTDKKDLQEKKKKPVTSDKVKSLSELAEASLKSNLILKRLGATWSSTPILTVRNDTQYVATVSKGEERTLEVPKSGASLNIPREAEGFYEMAVFTDHPILQNNIPLNECLTSPLIDLRHKNLENETERKKKVKYKLTFPHIIDDQKMWRLMKVRKWERMKGGLGYIQMEQKSSQDDYGNYFVMDSRNITTILSHFCKITASISGEAGCKKQLKAMLFCKLDHPEDQPLTLMKFKTFFCSRLLSLEAFRNHLVKQQEKLGLTCVEEGDVQINVGNFEPEQLQVTNTLRNQMVERAKWRPSEDDDDSYDNTGQQGLFKMVQDLTDFLEMVPCPCRSENRNEPIAAMEVDAMTEGRRSVYRGRFDVIINARSSDLEDAKSVKVLKKINFTMPPQPSLAEPLTFLSRDDGYGKPYNSRKRSYEAILLEDEVSTHPSKKFRQVPKELEDLSILKVAKQLTEEENVYMLGLNLKLNHPEIEKHLADNNKSITMATYRMLRKWYTTQETRTGAYFTLKEALNESDLTQISNCF